MWGPCTTALTGVYLPDTLPGEDWPPCSKGLPPDEKKRKEAAVFDSAMERVGIYLDDVKYNGHRVTTSFVPSNSSECHYDDHSHVKTILGSSGSAESLHRDTSLRDEVLFMTKHIDRRIGFIIIVKCNDTNCDHCQSNPIRAQNAVERIGVKFPSPLPSETVPGHFLSYTGKYVITKEKKQMPTCR